MAKPFSAGVSEFAITQLMKYGWAEGKGLGKNEDGISQPIKASMKFNKTGIGHDASEEYTYQWWDQVFNSAASSIVVENSEKGVEVTKVNDVEIRTRKPLEAKLNEKEMVYGSFVKSEKLLNGSLNEGVEDDVRDCVNDGDVQPLTIVQLTDEEILKVCGGRTGHKAARHGHRLSGKLKRLQEQESAILLTNCRRKEFKSNVYKEEEKEESIIIKKKKKKIIK